MMTNNRCKRWVTTNQDEFQNPACKKIEKYIESEEFGRYEDCMINKDCENEMERAAAREKICCTEMNENREPTFIPTDSHIDPVLRATKKPWCRCLATGDPNLYEENREETKTDEMCYCRQCYKQLDTPMGDNPRTKIYSSTNFIDFRAPDYPFIENQVAYKRILSDKFQAYKAKADAEDAKKERKIVPPPPEQQDGVQANCIGNYAYLPPGKYNKPWKADESWWREESSECVKNLLKKYIWTSTYREMNKDGAALPLLVREQPTSCIERPPGDPIRRKPEKAGCGLIKLGDVFEKWDRPQVRNTAQRCDTIYNNPCLDRTCKEVDAYFHEQYLDRAKFAECPEMHIKPSEENLRLARENKLRLPYDKMIPHYTGYEPQWAPPVCKIKKVFNPMDPYDMLSVYQSDFMNHPHERYETPVKPLKPDDLEKYGISTNPINSLAKQPLPEACRLGCFLECKNVPCQRQDESYSQYMDCKKEPHVPLVRNFGQSLATKSEFGPGQNILVELPHELKVQTGQNSTLDMDIPMRYQKCEHKPKEDLMKMGTYVITSDNSKVQKGGNLSLTKKKEYKSCA